MSIEEKAKYYTGHLVVIHSIGLSLGCKAKTDAEEFFEERKSLGIIGYMNEFEAYNVMKGKS